MPASAAHMGFDYPPLEQLIYPEWNIYPIMEQHQQQQQQQSHSNQQQYPHTHSQALSHVNQLMPSRQPPPHSSHPSSSHPSILPSLPSHPSHSSSDPLILTSHSNSPPIDLDPPSMPSPLNYNPKAFTFQTLPTPYIDLQQQQQQQQHHGFTSIPQAMLSTSPSTSPQPHMHVSPRYVTSTISPKSHEKVGKKRKTSVASTPVVPTQPVTPPISRPVIHVRHGDGPGFERNQRFLSEKDATSFSCHHCKVKRSKDQLLFCHATIQIETYKSELDHVIPRMNEKKRKPKKTNLPIYHCAKRYCHGCMKKHYGQNVNEMDVEERICYICPSCEEDCACSECSRKQQRRSIAPIISHLKHLQLTYGLSHIAKTLLHTRRCDEPLPIPSSPITPNTQDDTHLAKYEITSHTSHDESHTSSSRTSHTSSFHTSHESRKSSRASSQPISSDHTKAPWIQSLLAPLPNMFPAIPLPSSSYTPHYPFIDYSSTSTSTSSSTESTPPQHTHALHDMIIHRPSTSHTHPSHTHLLTSTSHSHPPTHSRSASHPHPSHSQSYAPSHHKRRSLDHIDEETTKRIRVKRTNKK